MAWTNIPNAALLIDKPWTSALAFGLRDNIVSSRQASDGAPYDVAAWHPFNGVTIGDGNTGRVWSHAVDGAVASFETPNFVDGYEYVLMLYGISHSDFFDQSINVQARRQSDDGLSSIFATSGAQSGAAFYSARVGILQSRRVMQYHIGLSENMVDIGAPSAIKSYRVSVSSTTLDAGEALLYRRRFFA